MPQLDCARIFASNWCMFACRHETSLLSALSHEAMTPYRFHLPRTSSGWDHVLIRIECLASGANNSALWWAEIQIDVNLTHYEQSVENSFSLCIYSCPECYFRWKFLVLAITFSGRFQNEISASSEKSTCFPSHSKRKKVNFRFNFLCFIVFFVYWKSAQCVFYIAMECCYVLVVCGDWDVLVAILKVEILLQILQ